MALVTERIEEGFQQEYEDLVRAGLEKFLAQGLGAILWFIAAFPIMWFWSDSVPLVVFLSVYAIVTGHWSSYQASRVEVKQDQEGEA